MRRPAFTIAVLRGLDILVTRAMDEFFACEQTTKETADMWGRQGVRDMERAREWIWQMRRYMKHRKNKKSAEEVQA